MRLTLSRIVPPPVPGSPGSIGLDTQDIQDIQDSITPVSEDITLKEVGDSSNQVTAPLTSVFVEAITEVNIKQEGSVEGEGETSPASVIQLEGKEGDEEKC